MKNRSRVSALDYVQIQNLYACYNHCSDTGNADDYASCFTVDGVLHIETRNFVVKGRDSLAEYKRRDVAGRGSAYRRHWNGSLHLELLDRHTVRGRCYLQAFNGERGALPVLAGVGVYEDTIVKADGEWKFAERRLRMDASTWSPPAVSALRSSP